MHLAALFIASSSIAPFARRSSAYTDGRLAFESAAGLWPLDAERPSELFCCLFFPLVLLILLFSRPPRAAD